MIRGLVILVGAALLWEALVRASGLPPSLLPSPLLVAHSFWQELRSFRLFWDIAYSLSRWALGLGLAQLVAGLSLLMLRRGSATLRRWCVPPIHFLRFISPLSWMPFAVLWFGVGSKPVVFLIFVSTLFPLLSGFFEATERVPRLWNDVAADFSIFGLRRELQVNWPAAFPEMITHMRLAWGLGWVVLVAAEMLAGRGGLGFAILDARNGLRIDLVIVNLLTLALLALALDSALASLKRHPRLRFALEGARA